MRRIDPRWAIFNRLLAATAGLGSSTAIGSTAVATLYYPLREANVGVQLVLLFVLMIGESAAIHLPSEIILPAGGWLVVRQQHLGLAGVASVSLLAALANTVGSGSLYCVGRYGGQPLVRRFGAYFHLDEATLSRTQDRIGSHPFRALLTSRLLPVVRTYGGFVSGMFRVPPAEFLTATFVGSLLWALAFVGIGAELGEHWSVIERPAEIIGLIAAVGCLAIILWYCSRLLKETDHGESG